MAANIIALQNPGTGISRVVFCSNRNTENISSIAEEIPGL